MTKNNNIHAANLSLVILMFLVLGCSCQKLGDIINKSANTSSNTSASDSSSDDSSSSASSDEDAIDSRLTMTNYDKITIGMPRKDVEALLGGKGSEITATKGGGQTFRVIKWEGKDFKSVILTFRNDNVMTKSQVGLDKK